jgi:hypothetical protein
MIYLLVGRGDFTELVACSDFAGGSSGIGRLESTGLSCAVIRTATLRSGEGDCSSTTTAENQAD